MGTVVLTFVVETEDPDFSGVVETVREEITAEGHTLTSIRVTTDQGEEAIPVEPEPPAPAPEPEPAPKPANATTKK